jgi:DAK2 domain fusion protein YloV
VAELREITAKALLEASAQALRDRREEVDELNVFPVPDGDTGTNMDLTMDAVLAEVAELPEDPSVKEVCHAVTHGSLMGARGNSGVILSQVLRGLCEVFVESDSVDPTVVAAALARAETVCYQAVRKPVEGTMLTIVKDCASVAKRAAEDGFDLAELLDAVSKEARESVQRTPDLLDVLKEAGVVDAGAYGLALLLEGLVAALEGHEVRPFEVTAPVLEMAVLPEDDWDDDEYLYCTEFLILGEGLDRDEVQDFVSGAGGSELVVGQDAVVKVHVHTDDPAEVLRYATGLGEVAEVHINNMRAQTTERSRALRGKIPPATEQEYGIVAVSSGDGVGRILESLGVHRLVAGGQTMNPSTAELLDAAESLEASHIIVLPNNKNIVMAAESVDDLAERHVAVVPTTSVPEAFAALLALDEGASLDQNVVEMTRAAEAVRTGEVTWAVKDSSGAHVGEIREGQVIGISEHEIRLVGDDVLDVAVGLVGLMADGAETLTVLAGEQLTDEDLEALVGRVEAAHPRLEVDAHRGDQPHYPVVLGFE